MEQITKYDSVQEDVTMIEVIIKHRDGSVEVISISDSDNQHTHYDLRGNLWRFHRGDPAEYFEHIPTNHKTQFKTDVEPPQAPSGVIVCTCGADSCGDGLHADWCNKAGL